MLSQEQIQSAQDQIRCIAVELAGDLDDQDAFEHAMQACDHLRTAAAVPTWAADIWIRRGFEAAKGAMEVDPGWTKLADRVGLLLVCHAGRAVA